MLLALEFIMLRLSTMNTLDAALDFVRLTATTALRERRSSTHVLMKDTVGSTALIYAKSGILRTTASIRPRPGHGKPVDIVGSQPLIAFSRSSFRDSLPKAKNNPRPQHGRIQGRQSRLTRARTTVVTRLLHQIPHLQVSLRLKLDHWPRPNSHLLQSRINHGTRLLLMAATFLHPTQWDLLPLAALVPSAVEIVLMSSVCLLATTAT